MLFVEIKRDDLVVGGVAGGLTYAEQQAKDEQRREGVYNPGQGGSGGPEQEGARENPVDVEAIDYPAIEEMQAGIGPEKRGKQKTQLRGRYAQLVPQHRSGDGKIAAIDVIDEDGNR